MLKIKNQNLKKLKIKLSKQQLYKLFYLGF
jgi:hypothetical protein